MGVGAGQGAITALRTGQIDAIANLDPVISTLVKADELKVIADTRTLKDTHEIFGGDMPSGCLYTAQKFIDANPRTTQARSEERRVGKEWGSMGRARWAPDH